jgi:hypothetical protein
MVEMEVKICNFCKTPFKEGRNVPPPKKSFTPPEVVIKPPQVSFDVNTDVVDNSQLLNITENYFEPVENIISRVKPSNISELYKDIRNPSDKSLDINLDALGFIEDELDFKELKKRVPQSTDTSEINIPPPPQVTQFTNPKAEISDSVQVLTNNIQSPEIKISPINVLLPEEKPFAHSVIKDRVNRFSEKLVAEDPFNRSPFEIDALELSEVQFDNEIEEQEPSKAGSVDVDPEKLKEINELARIMAPQEDNLTSVKITAALPETEEFNKFENKSVIRTSNNEIIEQTEVEQPSQFFSDIIDTLESGEKESFKGLAQEPFAENNYQLLNLEITDLSSLYPENNDQITKTEDTDEASELNLLMNERLKRFAVRGGAEELFLPNNFSIETVEIAEVKETSGIENEIVIEELNLGSREIEPVIDGTITELEIKPGADNELAELYISHLDNNPPEDQNGINSLVKDRLKRLVQKEEDNITDETVRSGQIEENKHIMPNAFTGISLKNIVEEQQAGNNPGTGPRSTTNLKALSHYNTAKDLCVKGNYHRALEELETAVKEDPAFEQAHVLLSRTYLKLKTF